MKVLQRQTILFTLLVMFSFSCFLYLQLAYPNGKNVSVEENIYVETENIFENSEKNIDHFYLAKVVLQNIINVIIIK
ncbi:MAG: hypothetical protein IPH94_05445 [Saprospiraceae bacterium]|nr:hypothetical protein [Saprospiraceae bacterium]MBK7220791.1 hypothetical protein [Saprospiraceae bacterium]MBK7789617.1 hypothetical protein [Saprospiraceae bacterium]MBK8112330.1 hypothetical protein [Saprospiraceae bacterium]MBK8851108.1 hypothetical protein [Saprospiraceae bacterium]